MDKKLYSQSFQHSRVKVFIVLLLKNKNGVQKALNLVPPPLRHCCQFGRNLWIKYYTPDLFNIPAKGIHCNKSSCVFVTGTPSVCNSKVDLLLNCNILRIRIYSSLQDCISASCLSVLKKKTWYDHKD